MVLGWIILVVWLGYIVYGWVSLFVTPASSSWEEPPRPDSRAGVREPRKPKPGADGDAMALPLP